MKKLEMERVLNRGSSIGLVGSGRDWSCPPPVEIIEREESVWCSRKVEVARKIVVCFSGKTNAPGFGASYVTDGVFCCPDMYWGRVEGVLGEDGCDGG